ncbi:MAG: RagB/SusD family nutrient uptake outer membrane protein [Bacteroidetes bacterium]|nr:MAG: RagB/SusD family nutrient uptake outer membrane protein [Bacteroidota bacterium]
MKTLRKTIVLFILITAMWGCEDFLDIKPQQSIDSDYALNTPENVKATLIGAYLEARSRWTFGSQFNEYAELLAASGHLQHVGSHAQPKEMLDKSIAVNNSYVESSWVASYRIINTVNHVLSATDILEDADRDRIKGEALFLRGMTFFELTRLWGLPYQTGSTNNQPGIPLILSPTRAPSEAIPVARNTVEECYSQILDDLIAARDLLPQTNGVFADSYAASALLSRVYLQMSWHEDAATEANRVIESGRFALNAQPVAAHNNTQNTSEDIFALQNSLTSNTIWLTERYASLNGMGRGDYQFTQAFLDLFHQDDLRSNLQEDTRPNFTHEDITSMYYIGVGAIRNGGINTYKWANYYAGIPIIRLSEMYLVRAEANFELQQTGSDIVGSASPLNDLNVVRARASAPLLTESPTQEEIRKERYFELCWEGHRLHDLKRWQLTIGNLNYNAGNLILPIPMSELETNPLLEQNPHYQ